MDYAPHTDDDLRAMLATLDLPDVDALFDQVPASLRAPADLFTRAGVADGLAESDLLDRMRALAARNLSVDDAVCFLGGGAYDHYQPALVPAIIGKPEFATAYTPYQPEMSQGGLQALFEFQTLASELLGLPIANSSLYDGATALVEGMIMCLGTPGRSRVVLAGSLDPRYRQTLATFAPGLGVELVTADPAGDGALDPDTLAGRLEGAAALVVQHPNAAGVCEDLPALAEAAHGAGAQLLVSFDAILAGVLEPPGRLGADVVVADGLSIGNGLQFGGPGVGLLACRSEDVRRLPGRLVGQTVDLDGKRGFVLTLQAREQHIRRDKATSNICTNQSLNALATAVYLSWLGPQGLVELGEACLAGTAYAAEQLASVAGVELAHPGAPVGKEFALRVADPVDTAKQLAERGYLVGPVVEIAGEDLLLVAVTEQRTRADIDGLVEALRAVA
ncbi:MAG: aminomethyl-transferring glycine dehydrogenase subunit GcvPA [Mycobacteriales bacterium]